MKVDGEEAVLHITDQSVMFERDGGKITGFEREAIRMLKPVDDAMAIAYAAGPEIRSVRVEPVTAAASLLIPGPRRGSSTGAVPATGLLTDVFEKLYWGTRRELEERLAEVSEEPENMSLRLTEEEEERYNQIRRQMRLMVGVKFGFDTDAPGNSLGFFGLEKEPYERQFDTIKVMHLKFLQYLASPRAEITDISYSIENVWPDDWERVLVRFKLADGPFLSEKYMGYLKTKWTRTKDPSWDCVLVRP